MRSTSANKRHRPGYSSARLRPRFREREVSWRPRQDEPARLAGFVRQSIKHSERLIEARPLIEKAKKRAEVEKRTIAKANLDRKRTAETGRQKYRDIVEKLYAQKPALKRASRERLAQEVQAVLDASWISKTR